MERMGDRGRVLARIGREMAEGYYSLERKGVRGRVLARIEREIEEGLWSKVTRSQEGWQAFWQKDLDRTFASAGGKSVANLLGGGGDSKFYLTFLNAAV